MGLAWVKVAAPPYANVQRFFTIKNGSAILLFAVCRVIYVNSRQNWREHREFYISYKPKKRPTMKAVRNLKIMIIAVVGALLCTGCVVHRDHPRPPKHKKHHPKPKPPKHHKRHHHASTDAGGHGGTYYMS